jgi:hypothetical protein
LNEQLISDEHDQDFEYTKQHDISHVIADIMMKGATRNSNTRIGEGMLQDVKAAAVMSSWKNLAMQVRG